MAKTGLTVAGTCQSSIATINITGDVSSPASTTCSGGTYSVAVTFTATDGAKVVTLTQPTGGTVNRSFQRNNVAPAIAFTSPSAAATTVAAVSLAGTCATGLNVTLTGPVTGSPLTLACFTGTFLQAVTLTGADGAKALTATQTDAAGNIGTATLNLTLNTTTPTLAIGSPTAGSYVNSANKASFTVSGTCSENGQPVAFAGPNSFTGTVNCGGGTFSKALNLTSVTDGAFALTLTHTNAAGTSVTANLALNKLTTAPTLAVSSPTGASFVNSINKAAYTVSGTCSSVGSTINLTGSVAGTAVCAVGGTFSTALNYTAISDGAVSVTANMNDVAGNAATAVTVNFNKTITGPTLTLTSSTLTSNSNTASFGGSCVATSTITITGADTNTTTCTGGSTWTYTTASQSTDASRTYNFAETSTAGNTTTVVGTWVRKTVAPVVGFSLPLPGTATNSTTGITISGYCDSTAGNVALSGAGLSSPSSTACTTNAFSQNITMLAGDGSKTITVTQTDGAGNTTNVSRSFSLLTAGPTVTITSPANNAFSQANATLSGGCTNGLSVLITGPIAGSPISASCSGGAWTQPIVLTAPDATKAISASQTDAASNTSTANVSIKRLTAAPTIGFSSPAPGSSITAGNQASFAVTGSCTLAATTVSFSGPIGFPASQTATCDGSALSANLNFSGVGNGAVNLIASITDQAGNIGTGSLALSVAVGGGGGGGGSTSVTVSTPAANSYINSSNASSINLSGTCAGTGDGGTVSFVAGGTHSNVTCTTNAWSASNVNFSGATDGNVALALSFVDTGSNSASGSIVYIKDTVAPTQPGLNSYTSYTANTNASPSFTWNASTDATSGINHYDVALGTSSGGTQTVTWTNVGTVTSYQFTGLSLTSSTPYYITVRAVDNAGNISVVNAGPAFTPDKTAPTVPTGLTYAATFGLTTSTPPLSWTSSTDTSGSGVNHYEIAVASNPGTTYDIMPFSSSGASNVGNNTSGVTVSGLSLTMGNTYYVSVRAVDNAGNISTVAQGAGWTVSAGTTTFGRSVFNYTGSNTTFTVPAGVTTLNVRGWAGGGAAGNSLMGGASAMATDVLTVTPGTVLTITVGQGGQNVSGAAGGGGATYIKNGSTILFVVGAGGGTGTVSASNSYGAPGGCMGGSVGYANNPVTGARSGNQNNGGAGGGGNATAGAQLLGGNGVSGTNTGDSGAAFGGGGHGYVQATPNGAGGGGRGYYGRGRGRLQLLFKLRKLL